MPTRTAEARLYRAATLATSATRDLSAAERKKRAKPCPHNVLAAYPFHRPKSAGDRACEDDLEFWAEARLVVLLCRRAGASRHKPVLRVQGQRALLPDGFPLLRETLQHLKDAAPAESLRRSSDTRPAAACLSLRRSAACRSPSGKRWHPQRQARRQGLSPSIPAPCAGI